MLILPSGYRKLNYIRSTGTQYIDTGFTPNQDTRVTVRCECPSSVEDTIAHHLFSSYETLANRSYALYYYRGNYCSAYGTEDKVIRRDLIAGVFEADKDKNVVRLDGTAFTHGAASFTCPGPLYLFAANSNGSAARHSTMALYSCQIYDNGALVRNYVPCAAPTGTVGLYDTVERKFYSNSGTGAFEAGFEFAAQEAMLKAIADAIREKDGSKAPIPAMNFPERIRTIPEGGVNANLLDNWYFGSPVNRNGEVKYDENAPSKYCVDRWHFGGSGRVLALDEGKYATFCVGGEKMSYPSLRQSIDAFEQYAGMQVTLSLLYRKNAGTAVFGVFASASSIETGYIGLVNDEWVLGQTSFFLPERENMSRLMAALTIRPPYVADITIDIIAAKLELGNRQTLAHQDADGNWVLNEIPNFAAEYAKCAQYDLATGNWVGYSQIAVNASDPAGGSVSGGGLASNGVTMTVKAAAAEGYRFAGWQENGQTVSESAEYTFHVSGDRELTAVFEPVQ